MRTLTLCLPSSSLLSPPPSPFFCSLPSRCASLRHQSEGVLRFVVVRNNGETQNLIWLVALKNLFARQLPRMPREYIVRLVFDRHHHSMIAIKNYRQVSRRPASQAHEWPAGSRKLDLAVVGGRHLVRAFKARNHVSMQFAGSWVKVALCGVSCLMLHRPAYQIIGGITFRVHSEIGLGEIAFCAVDANEQVRVGPFAARSAGEWTGARGHC